MKERSILFLLPGFTGVLPLKWRNLPVIDKLPVAFQKIIAKSSRVATTHKEIQSALEEYLHIARHIPWGWLGIRGEGFKVASTDWFKIEVFDKNGNYMESHLDINEIARDFAQDFNYAEDAIITGNGNWYMSLGQYKQVYSTPPWIVDEINIKTFGLMGNDAPIWQMRFQEAKKWLKSYSYQKNWDHDYHFFWPWGNSGSAPFVGEHFFSAIFSDNVLYRGLGEHMGLMGLPLSTLMENIEDMLNKYSHVFIYDDRFRGNLINENIDAWQDQRNQFVNTYILPMIDALKKRPLDTIVIDDALGYKYIYSKKFHFQLKRTELTYHFKSI